MVCPILNECNVYLRRRETQRDSYDVDQVYLEPFTSKRYEDSICVPGQLNFRKFAERVKTEYGSVAKYKIVIIFNAQKLTDAGLFENDDESLDLQPGDIVAEYETSKGKNKKLNLIVDRVQPSAQDFFTAEKKFLLVYVYCKDDTETDGIGTLQ